MKSKKNKIFKKYSIESQHSCKVILEKDGTVTIIGATNEFLWVIKALNPDLRINKLPDSKYCG